MPEPALSEDVTASELDPGVRRDLRGLQRDTADTVAKHLVAAGRLVDEDPERALEHARFARARASRIAVVREAAGIVAYHAGEWAEALGELRAARRMGGGPGHLAVMADIERALGRPERALELSRGPEARELDRAESIELAIVAAGARRDLGELDAAVVSLQTAELEPTRRDPWSARLFYAYADNLLAAGRESDALQWFVHAADADEDGETDAARRIAELTGEPLPDDDVAFGVEDEPPAVDGEADTDGDAEDAPVGADADDEATDRDSALAGAPGGDTGTDADAEVADAEVADADDAETDDAETDDAETDDAETDDAETDDGPLDGDAGADTVAEDAADLDSDSADSDSADSDSADSDSADSDSADSDSAEAVDDTGSSGDSGASAAALDVEATGAAGPSAEHGVADEGGEEPDPEVSR